MIEGKKARGVLVATRNSMSAEPGGQQICTREFISAIEAAGISLVHVVFDPTNGWREKIGRRIDRRPFRWFIPKNLPDRIDDAVRSSGAEFIFLNTSNVAHVAERISRKGTKATRVLLSHGLLSVDSLHWLRTQNRRSDFAGLVATQAMRLGQSLIEECKHRQYLDAILCLADFEAEIERWLGARRVLAVPRVLTPALVNWGPIAGRIGYVGRLDHPPNLEGLLAVLHEVQQRTESSSIEIRLVGAPSDLGRQLASDFSFVKYLGLLSDAELAREAATWTCSINPILCYAMGASTKLAVIVSWGIPVITTPQGARGYEWRGGTPLICDDIGSFTDFMVTMATNEVERRNARDQIIRLLDDPITVQDVAERIRAFLMKRVVVSGTISSRLPMSKKFEARF